MNVSEETIPGPKRQLGRAPKGITSPLLKRPTVLMVRVSWQGEVAMSRACPESDKSEAQDSPLLSDRIRDDCHGLACLTPYKLSL